MKIEEAIENNKEILERGSMVDDQKDSQSIKLGNKAMSRLERLRDIYGGSANELLPGETK